jgi:hypothetical protein
MKVLFHVVLRDLVGIGIEFGFGLAAVYQYRLGWMDVRIDPRGRMLNEANHQFHISSPMKSSHK